MKPKKMKKSKWLMSAAVILSSCKVEKGINITFFSDFEKDTVKLYYDKQLLMDSVLTTNYSTGLAYLKDWTVVPQKYLVVSINGVCDSTLVTVKTCAVSIKQELKRIHVTNKQTCKKVVYY